PLFAVFLPIYLVTVIGNLLIILAIQSDTCLQTPMYFFLSVLSFVDICYVTVIIPKMPVNFSSETKIISYGECLTQMYFFIAFGSTDSYLLEPWLLTATCHRRCVLLLIPSFCIPHFHSILRILLTNQLIFSASSVIQHFFCNDQPVLKLSCSSHFVKEIIVMTEGLAVIITPFSCIIISYLRILMTVLKIPSVAGKLKAFSTCGSHLTVVTLFYGSISYVYFQPLSNYTVKDLIATIIYTILTTVLNPFIHLSICLRNKDMKQGLAKLMHGMKCQ
uniref:Olfactory receptor family 1 subfamily L member 1 n=1 Tax=Macaca nemestrina TaxID=9545 RepID=A0A2K6BCC1_MACNE